MIVTVTPNPSVDRTITVPAVRVGEVNRALSSRIDPGGKGINVTRALTSLGSPSLAVLPTGGPEGQLMTQLLTRAGVAYRAVPIVGQTRMNVAAVEPDGTTTKLNEAGPVLEGTDTAALLQQLALELPSADWLVACGSLPPGVPDDFYARLVTVGREHAVRVAVDSSGTPLAAAVAAGPDLIKPNHEELAELVGTPLTTLGEVIDAAHELVAGGVGAVVVSLGADGAVLVDSERCVWAGARVTKPLSTVGAGDCLLAGLLSELQTGHDPERALVAGTTWGAAAVRLPGSVVPTTADLQDIEVTISHHPDPTIPIS
ncbi:1-phosphofructokinase/6-phosphofructokinase 2 [Branchiibius hedensis]|uniref:1-phosphofructokinase n=1 Tax=Branchiibius hedensis TaxID=672460 RepID=A0A2Y9C1C8_9MICO|nr:1-phosphofructokinase [Branchiibius hedensis]PWJ25299.1 1-phosphofructokinase/6-phosphofructokinase 2 [Branchiibius hedensis]SSA34113.1 1-phosphofructokinase [Branchiibius hedensis]